MSRKYYLAWKNAACNGVNPEWIFMTGKEFYSFIKKPENKNRYFITLDNRVCTDEDIITMECTKEKYQEWRVQKNHEAYLDKFKREHECISINSYIPDSETMTYEEVITDDSVDVEDDLMRIAKNKLMKDFFETLQPEEKAVIKHLYIENTALNETEVAIKIGIPRQTLNHKKINLRKKLKTFLSRNGF